MTDKELFEAFQKMIVKEVVYDSEKLTNEEVAELEEFYNIKLPNETNSLYKEIKEILYWSKQLIPDYGEEASKFNPSATEEVIINWEKENNITIPEQYKDWLHFSNGSQIRSTLAQFYGVQRIKLDFSNIPEIPEDLVVIGSLIGDGERLCFSKTTGEFVCYFQGKEDRNDDFKEILKRTIIGILKES